MTDIDEEGHVPGDPVIKEDDSGTTDLDPAQIAYVQRREAILGLLRDEGAQKLIWDILAFAGVYQGSNHSDPNRMAIQAGKREVGLYLIRALDEAVPGAYIKLQEAALRGDFDGRRSHGDT